MTPNKVDIYIEIHFFLSARMYRQDIAHIKDVIDRPNDSYVRTLTDLNTRIIISLYCLVSRRNPRDWTLTVFVFVNLHSRDTTPGQAHYEIVVFSQKLNNEERSDSDPNFRTKQKKKKTSVRQLLAT